MPNKAEAGFVLLCCECFNGVDSTTYSKFWFKVIVTKERFLVLYQERRAEKDISQVQLFCLDK